MAPGGRAGFTLTDISEIPDLEVARDFLNLELRFEMYPPPLKTLAPQTHPPRHPRTHPAPTHAHVCFPPQDARKACADTTLAEVSPRHPPTGPEGRDGREGMAWEPPDQPQLGVQAPVQCVLGMRNDMN